MMQQNPEMLQKMMEQNTSGNQQMMQQQMMQQQMMQQQMMQQQMMQQQGNPQIMAEINGQKTALSMEQITSILQQQQQAIQKMTLELKNKDKIIKNLKEELECK